MRVITASNLLRVGVVGEPPRRAVWDGWWGKSWTLVAAEGGGGHPAWPGWGCRPGGTINYCRVFFAIICMNCIDGKGRLLRREEGYSPTPTRIRPGSGGVQVTVRKTSYSMVAQTHNYTYKNTQNYKSHTKTNTTQTLVTSAWTLPINMDNMQSQNTSIQTNARVSYINRATHSHTNVPLLFFPFWSYSKYTSCQNSLQIYTDLQETEYHLMYTHGKNKIMV